MGDASIRALEDLYRHRYRRFLRLATAIAGSPEVAADAVQEGFANAIRSRHSFRGEGPLEAWVWRMVMNAAIDSGRRAPLVPTTTGIAEQIDSDWQELRAAVAALPERQRHILFLRHYADLSYEEIGAVLGIARGTVAAALNAAHSSLRSRIPEIA